MTQVILVRDFSFLFIKFKQYFLKWVWVHHIANHFLSGFIYCCKIEYGLYKVFFFIISHVYWRLCHGLDNEKRLFFFSAIRSSLTLRELVVTKNTLIYHKSYESALCLIAFCLMQSDCICSLWGMWHG